MKEKAGQRWRYLWKEYDFILQLNCLNPRSMTIVHSNPYASAKGYFLGKTQTFSFDNNCKFLQGQNKIEEIN